MCDVQCKWYGMKEHSSNPLGASAQTQLHELVEGGSHASYQRYPQLR